MLCRAMIEENGRKWLKIKLNLPFQINKIVDIIKDICKLLLIYEGESKIVNCDSDIILNIKEREIEF